jgi:hypothetical protein
MTLQHIATKRLVGRKIKPFVNLFSMAYGKTQILEPFPMEFKTLSKRVHLSEINKNHLMNLIKLIYKKYLCQLMHYLNCFL